MRYATSVGLAAAWGIAGLLPQPVTAAEDILLKTRIDPVDVQLFVPKESRPVQGLLVHVFNYKMKPHDRWATLCRQMKWAHINTVISRKANNRPKKIRHAINESLKQFAEKLNMPQLVHVPRAGTGFSAGGMVIPVLAAEPQKMLTNAISCSWVSDPAKLGETASIPEMYIIGALPDGFNMLPAIEKFYEPAIAAKRPWGLGLQHGCKHDWANSGTLLAPWIVAIAKMRYPDKIDPTQPIRLRPVKFEEGWRGDRTTIHGTFATVAPAAEFKGDVRSTVWLPDRATACIWRAWQTKKSPVHLSAEASDGSVKLPPFSPKKGLTLMVKPGVDVKLGVRINGGVAIGPVSFYHGDTLIGKTDDPARPVVFKSQPVGIYAVWARHALDGKPAVTNPALICFEPGG
ncbi:MAG: hypothetical protein R3236_08080 [Phycisphaeraceae bacterium]|nr:hypothetical protein [Phycisphaeraceae bacterium]